MYNNSSKFQAFNIFGGSTARLVSDLVGNPEDRVSRDASHMISWRTDGNKCQNNQIIRVSVKDLGVRKRACFGDSYIALKTDSHRDSTETASPIYCYCKQV